MLYRNIKYIKNNIYIGYVFMSEIQISYTIELINNSVWYNKIGLSVLSLILVLCLLLSVAYAILLERKFLASIQRRRGPNFVGFLGLLQPIADAIKLILKETIIPASSNKIIFILAPLLSLTLSLLNWSIIPLYHKWIFADIQVSILMFFSISSLAIYGIIMSGWASNSKYAFLGALRAAAQVIAYEICIGLTLIYIIIQTGSLNYNEIIWFQIVIWNVIPSFIFFFLFFIAGLAETNRPPFDLPEAEAELVSGYNVEYSAMTFGFFFLSEYVSIWTICILNVIIFWGGYYVVFDLSNLLFFILKIIFFVIVFIWVRGSVPRYRYDQLMRLGWKILLPIALGTVWLYTGIYYYWLYLEDTITMLEINKEEIIEKIKEELNKAEINKEEEEINKEEEDINKEDIGLLNDDDIIKKMFIE